MFFWHLGVSAHYSLKRKVDISNKYVALCAFTFQATVPHTYETKRRNHVACRWPSAITMREPIRGVNIFKTFYIFNVFYVFLSDILVNKIFWSTIYFEIYWHLDCRNLCVMQQGHESWVRWARFYIIVWHGTRLYSKLLIKHIALFQV